MRKLMLSAAALLCGAIMFAQNDPITDTSGDTSPNYKVSGVAPVATGANTGLSIQNGNDNKVRVRQAGTSQDVYTHQDDGTGIGGNLATIMQTGSVQAESGVANKVNVMQSGTENQSRTKQEGDYNMAITKQGKKNDASSGNKAMIRQGVAQQAEFNYAAIEQDGHDNQARTQQTYDNSDAWTQQMGDDNKSQVIQNAGPNGTDGHSAMVDQLGNRNESTVSQSGLGGRNTSTLWQWGDDNKAGQFQTTTAAFGNLGNRAGMQQGADNLWLNTPLVDAVFTPIYNIDNENVPVFGNTLESYGALGIQNQGGFEQAADMLQFGGSVGDSNYGEQEQLAGHNNEAAMVQGHVAGDGGDNYAKQEQKGNSNYAGLAQSGSGMKALQTQHGHNNYALSSQRGESHKLNVHQRGEENWATTAQGGLGNVALVVQKHGQSYSVEQNLDLGRFDLSAGANQADILQLGPDGNFLTDGIDCYFDPQLPPPTWEDIPDLIIDPICVGCPL